MSQLDLRSGAWDSSLRVLLELQRVPQGTSHFTSGKSGPSFELGGAPWDSSRIAAVK